jgi:precorrin-3B synthase
MIAPSVRGACPSLLAPMPTGDGLLARIVPAGPMKLKALAGLCASARVHGNGTMEISARGCLQVRGLRPDSAPPFAAAVSALGIEINEGVPVIAGPLGDEPSAPLHADTLARELRQAIAAAGLAIAPKVSVIVDGGGRLHLDALAADIRVRVVATADGPLLHIALAGDGATAAPLGAVAPDEVCNVVLHLLASIAAQGPEARAADVLLRGGIATFRDAIRTRIVLESSPPPRLPAEPVGTHCLKDDLYALGVGLAFGHAQAHTLRALTETARAHGALWARPALDRTLLLWPFKRTKVKTIRDEAGRLGFAVEPSDSRRRIVACPGAPACASGLIESRAIAAALAQDLPLHGDRVVLHVSGCTKGCAHAASTPLTVVGTEQGCGIVRDGTARATPSSYANPAGLVEEIERIIETREVAHA